jgi:site-specific recombinase XerD
VRAYLVGLVRDNPARGTFSINLCGVRFFFRKTVGREWNIFDLARPKVDKKLPVVLSRDEVWAILDAVTIPVYRACLTTIYSCGLRLLEGATLSIPQVDSARMQLHINGKGGRDRSVPLPTHPAHAA